MFNTGLIKLHRAGKVTNRRKGPARRQSRLHFAMGNARVYDWLDSDGRELVRFLRRRDVNEPAYHRAQTARWYRSNGALSVDLCRQVVGRRAGRAPVIGDRRARGFVTARHSRKAAARDLLRRSRRAGRTDRFCGSSPQFAPGTCARRPRHQVDVVITEHGAAERPA